MIIVVSKGITYNKIVKQCRKKLTTGFFFCAVF